MTGRVTSALRLRSLHVALLAALLLIIGGTQASADASQTPFKIAWSACEKSPQTQCGTLKVPLDWSMPLEQPFHWRSRADQPRTRSTA